MTSAEPAGCGVLPPSAVASYAAGGLDPASDWSVEAHVPGCPACRVLLTSYTDAGRLAANRAELLVRVGLPEPGPVGRLLRCCGVPQHVALLLEATPSLRRSWLAGVLLVLAVAVGGAQLANVHVLPGPGMFRIAPTIDWATLAPFLAVAPLLPLAAVAAAFARPLDPAYQLASAAPVSMLWLLCVRTAATVAVTLVPTALAALALPGPMWLAVALLLPALALCGAALGLATVIRPEVALAAVAAGWMGLVIALAVTAGTLTAAFGTVAQLTAAAVLLAGVALIVARRHTIDYGWME
ncbi:MAG TPA: zf-HC2 domain-containing protein [Streptosporangiaceae bacterium]|nr:zf-HC2 domain-containing protein [Streptosporangiaceae bacterium]